MYSYFTIVDLYFVTSKGKKPDSCMNKTQPCVIQKKIISKFGH